MNDPSVQLLQWDTSTAAAVLALVLEDRDDIRHREPWRGDDFFTLEGQTQRALRVMRRCTAGSARHWVIGVDGEPAGDIGLELRLPHSPGDWCDVGYWVALRYRGAGVATAALQLVLHEARALGRTTVAANSRADNTASLAVLRHCGFEPQGPVDLTATGDRRPFPNLPHVRLIRALGAGGGPVPHPQHRLSG